MAARALPRKACRTRVTEFLTGSIPMIAAILAGYPWLGVAHGVGFFYSSAGSAPVSSGDEPSLAIPLLDFCDRVGIFYSFDDVTARPSLSTGPILLNSGRFINITSDPARFLRKNQHATRTEHVAMMRTDLPRR